ncbi:hypothetical protein JL720_10068 [Aureococcus anophagefferens]|nr:hypothetical protein JL720_10068 [Aureococcus anophagefferens]
MPVKKKLDAVKAKEAKATAKVEKRWDDASIKANKEAATAAANAAKAAKVDIDADAAAAPDPAEPVQISHARKDVRVLSPRDAVTLMVAQLASSAPPGTAIVGRVPVVPAEACYKCTSCSAWLKKASDVVEPFVGAACAPDTATERRGAQKGPGVLLCDGGGVTMACVALRDSVRALAKSCAAGGVHVPGAVVAMRELVHARAESAAAAAARDKADALALEEARYLRRTPRSRLLRRATSPDDGLRPADLLRRGPRAADRVRHADSLICTKHDVQTAANLAMDRFPGARRDVISRSGWTRIGIERAALTAAFLRDPSVVVQADGGASTARRKTKWFLKEGVPRLLKRLNRRLADAGLRRSSEAHFRGLLAGPGYAKLTAELCTCERLYNQIDAEERFRSGEFRSHLKEESHVAQHCLCYLLSSENEPCFREPCVHGRKDGSTLSPPKTMEEIVAPRRLTRRDHEDECMVCYGDEGSLLCCAYCARAAHKECIRRHHNDLGGSSDSWTCWDCVRERSLEQHDGSCAACDGHAFLMGDLRSLAAVADAKIRDGVASGDLDGATVLEENGDASIVGVWARSVVAKSDVDLRAYHGHIAQDVCTTPYQKFVTSTLKDHEYTTIYDYWAKQSAKLHMEGTCEGQGNKGVSSRQDSFDTAVTLFAEEGEYRKAHPWLTTNAGDMSDGASNFRSTPAALYNMQSPYPTYKATSVSGHGKDVVDADNGVEQPKLRAAVDAGSDLTCASQYVAACDARRHTGVVNMRVEIDRSLDLTAEEKKRRKSIVGIGDAHFYACPYGGDLRTWEVFSRRLSIEAGRLVGIGPGRVVSRALLVSDHLLDRHALDVASAALTYPGESALPTDQQLLVNPAPFLSPDQKKTAAVAKEAAVEARDAAREERAVARRAPLVATFRNLRPHACPNCLAKFSSPARLRSHRLRGCGSSAAGRAERRLAHDATTIDALLAKSDGDLADALEARAELGLDLVTATFAEGALGFTCEQLDAAAHRRYSANSRGPFLRFRGTSCAVRSCASRRTALDPRPATRSAWAGAPRSTTAPCSRGTATSSPFYSGHASGQEHESHFSHVEIGTRPPSSGDVDDQTLQTSHEPAVVASVEPPGAAAAALVQVGFEVVDVGGTAAPTYSRAKELLEHAARPISVTFRRPAPAVVLRGAARKTVCARPSHHWNEEVAGRLDALLFDPANQRRYENVYNALKSEFEFRVDDERRPLLPPRKAVETRMLNIWKKTKKEARDAAQNSAARDVARAARAAGVAAVDDDEVPSSDDDADDPMEMDTSPDGDANADGGADGGADAANDDPTDGYMAQLAGVGVRELRQRPRARRLARFSVRPRRGPRTERPPDRRIEGAGHAGPPAPAPRDGPRRWLP